MFRSLWIQLALCMALLPLSGAVRAHDEMSEAELVEFLAIMTAGGELCAARYPSLREWATHWDRGFDARTKAGVDKVRGTPRFADALAKARTDKRVLDMTEQQCNDQYRPR